MALRPFRAQAVTLPGVGEVLCLSLPLDPEPTQDGMSWVQLIPREGEFRGHPSGPFRFTAALIEEVIANFDREQTPKKFDYEHDTHKADVPGYQKISAGKIHKLARRDGEGGAQLWALVKWTPRAAEQIRNHEREYTSPVINFKARDRVTDEPIGAELVSAALTDTPFLDGQQAVHLSRFEMAEEEEEKTPPPPPEEEETAMAEEEPKEMADEDDPSAFMAKFSESTGRSKAAALAWLNQNIDKISAMSSDDADGETRMTDERFKAIAESKASDDVKALTREVQALRKDKAERDAAAKRAEEKRVRDHVVALTNEGKVHSDKQSQADAVWAFSTDWDRATRMYAEQVVPLRTQQAGKSPAPAAVVAATVDDLSAEELATFTRWTGSALSMNKDFALQRLIALRDGE